MSAETPHEFGGGLVSCAQLEREEVDVLDQSVVAEFKVATEGYPEDWLHDRRVAEQLVEGTEGTCLTGQRGECPKGHNCGKVKIVSSVPPLLIEIEPLKVADDQLPQ